MRAAWRLWNNFEEGAHSRLAYDNLSANVPLAFADGTVKEQRFLPLCYSTTTLYCESHDQQPPTLIADCQDTQCRGTGKGGVTWRWRVCVLFGMATYLLLNVAATVCFKESGTDAERTWFYFVIGNVFGPLTLIFPMKVYSSMDANLGAALAMGLGAVMVQNSFWMAYAVTLSSLQWIGIGMVVCGAVIAVSGGRNAVPRQGLIGESNT